MPSSRILTRRLYQQTALPVSLRWPSSRRPLAPISSFKPLRGLSTDASTVLSGHDNDDIATHASQSVSRAESQPKPQILPLAESKPEQFPVDPESSPSQYAIAAEPEPPSSMAEVESTTSLDQPDSIIQSHVDQPAELVDSSFVYRPPIHKISGGRRIPLIQRASESSSQTSNPSLQPSGTPTPALVDTTAYRRAGSEVVFMDARPLSVTTLGRPMQAIVMQGVPHRARAPLPRVSARDSDETAEQAGPDKRGAAGYGEASRNIDELRPQVTSLPFREFRDLVDNLVEGFTAAQLQTYVKSAVLSSPSSALSKVLLDQVEATAERDALYSTRDQATVSPAPSSSMATSSAPSTNIYQRYQWIVKEETWLPSKEYEYPVTTQKERLVQLLVQDCWHLRVQELLDGRGTLELQIAPRIFTVLLSE